MTEPTAEKADWVAIELLITNPIQTDDDDLKDAIRELAKAVHEIGKVLHLRPSEDYFEK